MKPKGSGKEYLPEFVVQGAYVRCCAIDPVSGIEAVAVGAALASKKELSRALLRAGLDHLRGGGRQTAGLWVLDANEAACRFYEAIGWRASEVRSDSRNLTLRAYYCDVRAPLPEG